MNIEEIEKIMGVSFSDLEGLPRNLKIMIGGAIDLQVNHNDDSQSLRLLTLALVFLAKKLQQSEEDIEKLRIAHGIFASDAVDEKAH